MPKVSIFVLVSNILRKGDESLSRIMVGWKWGETMKQKSCESSRVKHCNPHLQSCNSIDGYIQIVQPLLIHIAQYHTQPQSETPPRRSFPIAQTICRRLLTECRAATRIIRPTAILGRLQFSLFRLPSSSFYVLPP